MVIKVSKSKVKGLGWLFGVFFFLLWTPFANVYVITICTVYSVVELKSSRKHSLVKKGSQKRKHAAQLLLAGLLSQVGLPNKKIKHNTLPHPF